MGVGGWVDGQMEQLGPWWCVGVGGRVSGRHNAPHYIIKLNAISTMILLPVSTPQHLVSASFVLAAALQLILRA
jgi:hypothetical protein